MIILNDCLTDIYKGCLKKMYTPLGWMYTKHTVFKLTSADSFLNSCFPTVSVLLFIIIYLAFILYI